MLNLLHLISSYVIYRILSQPSKDVLLTMGDAISYVLPSTNLKNTFYENFGVKFNELPQGEIPSDEWYKEFQKHLERPKNNEDTMRFAKKW